MILADYQIPPGMIEPFCPEKVRSIDGRRVISYGLSSFGYDIRLAPDGLVEYRTDTTVDPKRVGERDARPVEVRTDGADRYIEMAPGDFVLGYSMERFRIPRNILAVVLGKSTVARTGISLLATPLEPGWEGFVTLELTNVSRNWARVYVGEGIGQVLFLQGEDCETPYGAGTYQDQPARVVLPFGGGA